ncbi:sulfotransferase [Apostichopus japonicus]|uniref:Sulfotransferase n=1 Tax=Stichopus japonicus TaxID=307972 RepID=A0A2G8L5U1_STIJA|nr:sulfotransferase [Apostichopus japonicus]
MNDANEDHLWFTLQDFVKEKTYAYKGHLLSRLTNRKYLNDIRNFSVRSDDVYLISFPKSGTTWVQHIVSLIFDQSTYSSPTHLCRKTPFLEMPQSFTEDKDNATPGNYEIAKDMPSPRFLKTQLPISLLPEEFDQKRPKVIYVSRNPKDVAVSLYNFCSWSPNWPQYRVWSDFLHDFCRGALPRGLWFDSVLDWWQRRDDENVLFLKYEDLIKDTKGAVWRIAKFLERPLTEETVDNIITHSTFNAMKKHKKVNPDYFKSPHERGQKQNRSFMRKGQVGDWRNYFTVAQNDAFDTLFQEKMDGFGLSFEFSLP